MPGSAIDISEVRIRVADAPGDGPIAWASFVVNDSILLNNVAIFRDDAGEVYTQFPAKRGRAGQRYYYFCPINKETKQQIDDAVLALLDR